MVKSMRSMLLSIMFCLISSVSWAEAVSWADLVENPGDGLTELYYENGQLSIKSNFKNGEQHGLLKYFSEDGSLQRSSKYENGEMIID